jgi:4-hydroxy-tetrahydrodipicolinate synthase
MSANAINLRSVGMTLNRGVKMKKGSFTALVTPFTADLALDRSGLEKLAAFQIENGITGILAVGTTGESPTLSWNEHHMVVDTVASLAQKKCLCIAGAGSNNTLEALSATEHAVKAGANAVLLVDPYYNGPSSIEIRKEYISPVAQRFPEMNIIPYVIPGRTGAQLLPEDLAILAKEYSNVRTVKEATGNLDNMKRTRACCGPHYSIFSGDDGMTFEMMTDPAVNASGVISVLSNVAPKAVCQFVSLLEQGKVNEAKTLKTALNPLFQLVTVKTTESTPFGDVVARARNPLGVKTLMAILGMPGGPCRRPLGKMTRKGFDFVLEVARKVQNETPEIFQPIESFFKVDIAARLEDQPAWQDLYYQGY